MPKPKFINYEIKERPFIGTLSLHIDTEALNALPKVKLNDDGKEITFLEYLEAKGVKTGPVMSPFTTQADSDSSIPIKADVNINEILKEFVDLAKNQEHDIGFQDTKTNTQIVASEPTEQIVTTELPAVQTLESKVVDQATDDEVQKQEDGSSRSPSTSVSLESHSPEPGSLQLRFATTQDSEGNNWVLINREDFNLLAKQNTKLLNESEFFKELKQSGITTANASEASRDQPIAFRVIATFKVEDIPKTLKDFAETAGVECNPISVDLPPGTPTDTVKLFATLPSEISGRDAPALPPSAPATTEANAGTNTIQYSIKDLDGDKREFRILNNDYSNLEYLSGEAQTKKTLLGHLRLAGIKVENSEVDGIIALTFATKDFAKVKAALEDFSKLANATLAEVDTLPELANPLKESTAIPQVLTPIDVNYEFLHGDLPESFMISIEDRQYQQLKGVKINHNGEDVDLLGFLKIEGLVSPTSIVENNAGSSMIQFAANKTKGDIDRAMGQFAILATKQDKAVITLNALNEENDDVSADPIPSVPPPPPLRAAPTPPAPATTFNLRYATAEDKDGQHWLFINYADFDKLRLSPHDFMGFLNSNALILPPDSHQGNISLTSPIVRIAIKNADSAENIADTIKAFATTENITINTPTALKIGKLDGTALKIMERESRLNPELSSTEPPVAPAAPPPQTEASVNYFMGKVAGESGKKVNCLHINTSDYNEIINLKIIKNGKDVDLLEFLQSKKLQRKNFFGYFLKPSTIDNNLVIPLSDKCTSDSLNAALNEFAAKANIKFNEADPSLSTPIIPVTPQAQQGNITQPPPTAPLPAQSASVVATSTPNPGLHQPGSQTFMDKYKTAVDTKAATLHCTPDWSTTPYTIKQGPKTLGTLNHDAQKQSVTCAMAQNLTPAETQVMAQIHAAGLIAGFKKDDPITLTFAGDPDKAKVLAEQMLKDFRADNPNRAIEIACADPNLKAAIDAIKARIYTAPAATTQQPVVPQAGQSHRGPD